MRYQIMEKNFKEWEIEACIGEGAFGKVYKIVREEFGHTYDAALKVIEVPQNQAEYETIRNEMVNTQEAEEYFAGMVQDIVEEFTLMSKLKGNSNIVSYEDHSVIKKEDGYGWKIYIRMELLTGLFKHIKQVDVSNLDIVQLGIDICKALEVCQQYHIIHRDIKPENIFVSDVGTYKLGDFGIARELERTSVGLSKKGTRSYMAPEVYKGMEYNATVDIYSLGIVLYRFMNNNRLPFMPPAPEPIRYTDKEKADLLRMSGQPLPAPEKASDAFARVIVKACAYLPQERYQSASEMREELERVKELEQKEILFYHTQDKADVEKTETNVTGNHKAVSKLEEEQAETVCLEQQETEISKGADLQQEQEEGTVYMFHKNAAPEKENDRESAALQKEHSVDSNIALEQQKIQEENENKSVLQKTENKLPWNKKIGIGFVVLLVIVIGSIAAVTMSGSKSSSKEPRTEKVEDTKAPTKEPDKQATIQPKATKKPTAEPTKKTTPKATKKPKRTVVTQKPVVTTKKPVTAAPTKAPVRTKAPTVTRQPRQNDSNVFKERDKSDNVLQER